MHTSDIANMTEHGYLQITDRIIDVIKTGGEWISSLQLEDIIMKAPGVKEAAVIGVKDEKWGERPAAIVVRDYQAEEAPTENKIKVHVGRYADEGVISKYGVPHTILFVDRIERTSVGKIDKKLLRKRYTEEE
jgi:fatty-acyl-CoA synthase